MDPAGYCELAFPKTQINEVHYCTAIVKDAPWDPRQSLRQCTFIRAVETTGVKVHYGSFQSNVVAMPLEKPPKRGPRTVVSSRRRRRGSDVALGILLVAHAYQRRYRSAIVVSNDSDLILSARSSTCPSGSSILTPSWPPS